MWGLLNVWQAVGFAPFENVVVCPMTHKNIDSCASMRVSKRKMAPGTLEKSEAPGAF